MDVPYYPCSPIYSLNALSRLLGEPLDVLTRIAINSDNLYRYVPQKKKDGTPRPTYDAHEPLKKIQKKIASRILNRIAYPQYLHGGVKDSKSSRSIYTNCAQHLGKKLIILMDIEDFYPSISKEYVFSSFNKCLGFSSEVSLLLSTLLTRKDKVPQGACTSSHLANLVFWDVESSVYACLKEKGFTYTRFADDITISTNIAQENKLIGAAVSRVVSMLARKGCRLKRTKFHVRRRGQAIVKGDKCTPITITGLSAFNQTKPTITQSERNKIRSSVKKIEIRAHAGDSWSDLVPLFNRAMGRVGRLISCRHPEGDRLKRRLQLVKTYFESAVV